MCVYFTRSASTAMLHSIRYIKKNCEALRGLNMFVAFILITMTFLIHYERYSFSFVIL